MKKFVFGILVTICITVISCKQPATGEANTFSKAQVNALVDSKIDSVKSAMLAKYMTQIDSLQESHQDEVRTLEMQATNKSGKGNSVSGNSGKKNNSSSSGSKANSGSSKTNSGGKTGKVDIRRNQTNTPNAPQNKIDVRRNRGGGN